MHCRDLVAMEDMENPIQICLGGNPKDVSLNVFGAKTGHHLSTGQQVL